MLKARFVILPDSGLFHIATGLGVNILAFFTYTNPELVRPDAENCTIVFEPDDLCRSETNGLPFGAGTPSTDELLSITSSFLARLESREAYVVSHN
jgi:ADP-heptose:LPS heptosyltransferase